MKKCVLFIGLLVTFSLSSLAQTMIFEDNFESYDDGFNLAGADYVVWEGSATVSDITIDGGTAYEGNKFGKSDIGKNNFAFRKTFTLTAGKTYTWEIATKIQDGVKYFLQVNPTDTYQKVELLNADWEKHTLQFTVQSGFEEVTLAVYRLSKKMVSFDDFKLYESTPTTIDEQKKVSVSVYPNPTDGLIKVEGVQSMSGLLVYNSLGQLIKEISVDGSNVDVDLSAYANGLYFVTVHFVDGSKEITKVYKK